MNDPGIWEQLAQALGSKRRPRDKSRGYMPDPAMCGEVYEDSYLAGIVHSEDGQKRMESAKRGLEALRRPTDEFPQE
jgi:hypothetical protein